MSLAKEAFDLIRKSDDLGQGSCSAIDECYEDSELMDEIEEVIEEHPDYTPELIYQYFAGIEKIRNDYAEDIRASAF